MATFPATAEPKSAAAIWPEPSSLGRLRDLASEGGEATSKVVAAESRGTLLVPGVPGGPREVPGSTHVRKDLDPGWVKAAAESVE
eukprot:735856-Rhodomonas_salina.3